MLANRISHFFFELVYFFFLIIIQFQFKNLSKSPLNRGKVMETIIAVYPVLLITKLVIFAVCGELLSNQGKRAAIIIHKLMTQMPDLPTHYEVPI